MNTKLVSENALSIIDQYENWAIGKATCSIPYYNNRHLVARAKLRSQIGKGSPKDIFDEVESIATLEKIDVKNFDSAWLKKFLVDHNIGIDCSGFVYYVLDAESQDKKKGALDKHLSFPFSKGIIGKIRSKIRPVENTGVATLASDQNSRVIELKNTEPGDMVTMVGGPEGGKEDGQRDHILVIDQIQYQNFVPTEIHYVHAMAWPTDGEYGHGVRHGIIRVLDPNKNIAEQEWTEAEKKGSENYTFARASKSKTEIRRLNWL